MSYADSGRAAVVTPKEEWLPLGVFAMVQGEEPTSNHIFQLSINKQGVIRANYYDAVTDATTQISRFCRQEDAACGLDHRRPARLRFTRSPGQPHARGNHHARALRPRTHPAIHTGPGSGGSEVKRRPCFSEFLYQCWLG